MRHSIRFALLSTTLLVSSPVWAQDAAGEEDTGEIIVTAQKREENLQKVPMSIQAIGSEKLDQLQVKELGDFVKFLPSVTVQTGGPGFSQVYFRGVASGENANHSASLPTVGTYLDEMPITTIQGALDIHAFDLARVEALAGPQGTLYGASSMAGTIKMVTNKPDTSGFYGEVGAELNSVSRGGMGGVLEGFVNAPLSEKIALRAVGWYRKDAGYIDNIPGTRTFPTSAVTVNNAAFVEKNYNDADTYGGRLALGIELDEDWTLRPTIMGQVQKTNGSFAQERSSAVTRSLQTVQYHPESSKDKWMQAALTLEGKIGDWDLTYTGGMLDRKDRTESDYSDYAYFYDAIKSYGKYFYDNAGKPTNPSQYIQGSDKYKRYFSELRMASPADGRLRFIGGLFWQRQSHLIEQNYIIDNLATRLAVPGSAHNVWLTLQKRVDRDYAAFGEMTFDITEKLKLNGGIRVYRYDNGLKGFFGYSQLFATNFGVSSGEPSCFGPAVVAGSPCTNVNKSTKDTDFTHKLNLTYEFSDDAMVYATWSTGFRPGGVNRRGTLPPYGPDSLDNYEFGWKTSFADRKVRWNGAIYQLNWSDVQLSLLGQSGLTQIQNAGKARIRGIETDISVRQGGFSFGAGMSYNDAKLTFPFCDKITTSNTCATPAGNSVLAPSGTRLPVSAKFKGNATVRYEYSLGGMDAHIQMAVNHIGKRSSDLRTFENSITGFFGAYTTADLSLGVEKNNWSMELFATNLFNSRGIVNSGVQCVEKICGDAFNNTASGGVFYDNVIRPRLIGLKVGTKF